LETESEKGYQIKVVAYLNTNLTNIYSRSFIEYFESYEFLNSYEPNNLINEVYFIYLGLYFIINCGILFTLKFEVYEVHALQYCIFAPSFGMHKKTPWPDVGAVSTGTAMHVELSNVVMALTSFCWI
jgi:hypothetical protein